jgi:hypothetical protein
MIASLLERKSQKRFGTRFQAKNRLSDEMADNFPDRRTPKVALGEPTTKRNQLPRQTILYVPLPVFAVSEGSYSQAKVASCCRELQSVAAHHKLLLAVTGGCYRLQSVAKHKIESIPCPDLAAPFPF